MKRNIQTSLSSVALSLAVFMGGAVLFAQKSGPARGTQAPPPLSPPPPPSPRMYHGQGQQAQRPPRAEGVNPRDSRGSDSETGRRFNNRSESNESDRQANRRTDKSDGRNSAKNRAERAERTHELVRPTPIPRQKRFPTSRYWGFRYDRIFDDITFLSRRGFIPTVAVPDDVYDVIDHAGKPSGWKAYGFVVPPGESLTVNLAHPNKSWFRLIICDKWGDSVPGGLHSRLSLPTPRLTYTNPGQRTNAIYFIVDDPGWMSWESSPYTLEITRSWNPALFPRDENIRVASGIWGLERSINARFGGPMITMPGFM